MNGILSSLKHFAARSPNQPAIVGEAAGSSQDKLLSLSYRELWHAVEQASQVLRQSGIQRAALRADNSTSWAVADLAALAAGVVLVPVPLFFTHSQVDHLLETAGIDTLWGDWPEITDEPGQSAAGLPLYRRDAATGQTTLPDGTAKITFTSGSTGQPKGVCLSQPHLDRVARTLADTLQQGSVPEQHLVLLPLSTLLENIAGLYVPLMLGASTTLVSGHKPGSPVPASLILRHSSGPCRDTSPRAWC